MYVGFMGHTLNGVRVVPIAIIVILLVYGIFNATQAVKLEPPVEQELWFPGN